MGLYSIFKELFPVPIRERTLSMHMYPGQVVKFQSHGTFNVCLYYVVLDIIEDDVLLYDVRGAKTTWSSVVYIKNSFLFL